MSLASGVPQEFKRMRHFTSRGAAETEATMIRDSGYKARVIADPENDRFVLFKGPKRLRRPQARWSRNTRP